MKYWVKIAEVHTQDILVEAENEDAARKVASNTVDTGLYPDGDTLEDCTHYSYTIDYSEWTVWEDK